MHRRSSASRSTSSCSSSGTLVGLEIPLVLRLLKETVDFRELVARVLAFDYVGALFASLLFPIVLVPHLGLVRTSLAFGFANAVVGLWSTWLFAPLMGNVRDLRVKAVAVLVLLGGGLRRGRPIHGPRRGESLR